MPNSLAFPLCGLFFSILLIIVYFSKKRLETLENKVYKILIILSYICLLLELGCYPSAINFDDVNLLSVFVLKAYLFFNGIWMIFFTYYIFIVSNKNLSNDNIKRKSILNVAQNIVAIAGILLLLILIILPISVYYEGDVVYSYGLAVDFIYINSAVNMFIMLICFIKNSRNFKEKKFFPLFAFFVLGIIVTFVQKTNPGIILASFIQSFVTFLMYFTIENPDLQMINELNIAREQAEKANLAKTDFLSNMSHEIRTPLNAIVGFSQSLSESDISSEAKEEVKYIISASESLLDIVNGILDISKIEANKLEIINTEYNFHKVLNELVSLAKGRLGDKPLEFRTNFDQTIPPFLYGDYIRLKQIIINLLTNSIKYTKEGYIEFKVSSIIKGNICRLIISVEDSGIGIKKEKIDSLFEKFERADVEKNNSIEGTGLGLAITKKLIDLMQGQIVVQSEYGEGSKFTVAIDQRIVTNVPKNLISSTPVFVSDSVDVSGNRILIVDDNKINLKVASRLLQNYNVEIDEASSGQECIDKINNGEKYDLIFMDDMMPKMSGVETFALLKKIDGFNTPTIALTANAISGMKENYIRQGFNDYLAKPIERIELSRIIKKFLSKK